MTEASREQQVAWMAAWRSAAIELERIRREELRRVDHRIVVEQLDDALEAALSGWPAPVTSGLIEQQRLFTRLRISR